MQVLGMTGELGARSLVVLALGVTAEGPLRAVHRTTESPFVAFSESAALSQSLSESASNAASGGIVGLVPSTLEKRTVVNELCRLPVVATARISVESDKTIGLE